MIPSFRFTSRPTEVALRPFDRFTRTSLRARRWGARAACVVALGWASAPTFAQPRAVAASAPRSAPAPSSEPSTLHRAATASQDGSPVPPSAGTQQPTEQPLPVRLDRTPVAVSPEGLPLCTAEASEFSRTSTAAQVRAFVDALAGLEFGRRLRAGSIGSSVEGRDLLLVTVADPMPEPGRRVDDGRLRLLVNANIHAGEVEGKEAVQQLLREFAQGRHAALLERAVLFFVPIYNVDGNERIDQQNRVRQNGPDGGVGVRPNAQGLDLNRDFVKVESPECEALLALIREQDPHLFMDLHTTNGSPHGYHLTYSPSLSTNVDAELDDFVRATLLPEVRAELAADAGWRVFDYGNFAGRPEDGRSWVTYDHRPRFGTNYYGLRNRVAVLSEAYAYLDFESRVGVTRAFTLSVLETCVRHGDRIRQLCDRADRQSVEGATPLPYATTLAPGREETVLVGAIGEVELEDLGTRAVALDELREERMQVRDAFVSERELDLPHGWLLVEPSPAVLARLDAHGLLRRTPIAGERVLAREFRLDAIQRSGRPFQGHRELRLFGEWAEPSERAIPEHTVFVPARQRLSRVAAQLLEPASEDSLATWGFLIDEADVALEERARAKAAEEAGEPAPPPSEPHPTKLGYPIWRVERDG